MRFSIGFMSLFMVAGLLSANFKGHVAFAEEAAAKGTISGTVTKDSKPVAADTEVRLVKQRGGAATQPAGGGRPARMTPVATAKTDDKGAFTMSDVPAGSYNVQVGSRKDGRGTAKVEVKAGETATVTVTIEAAK